MLREMYCRFHCDPNQAQHVQLLRTNQNRAITELRVKIKRDFANRMFWYCSRRRIARFPMVNMICIKKPCTMEEFFRSLGATRRMGGTSPYLIDFQLTD
nr:unnamed protein product [Spirometra erinaceieuropaei]